MLRSIRTGLVVVFLPVAVILMASLSNGQSKVSASVEPNATPIVCTTRGTCFEVDNTGHGMAIKGVGVAKNSVGVAGIASNTAAPSIGVLGQSFGPSSTAVNARSFSTDASHPSDGVDGISANGDGVNGVTTFNSTLQLTAAAGVLGRDKSTQFAFDMGVFGLSKLGVGVAGTSASGNAVTGSSTNANGVVGQTSFFATSGVGQAGVLGQDLATPGPLGTPTVNVGVEGSSLTGTGILGTSLRGVAISAFSSSGTALTAMSNGNTSGADAIDAVGHVSFSVNQQEDDGGLDVNGGQVSLNSAGLVVNGATLSVSGGSEQIVATTNSVGLNMFTSSGPGPTAPPTLQLFNNGGGPLVLAIGAGNANAMSLDGAGNMILAGTLTQNGNPMVAHRKSNGWGVATYSAQQTMQTVEDLGEAQLIQGQAFVRLDPAFASLLNPRSTYLVFLTAQGDCRGLFVAQKTLSGFAVQEMDGGHSSIAFDYRIVGKPVDASGARLPTVAPIRSYHVRVPQAVIGHGVTEPKTKRFAPVVRSGYVPSPLTQH